MRAGRLRYFSDPPHCDRWSSPARTLARRGGDCDDLAILAAGILLRSRLKSTFVVVGSVWNGRTWMGHAWVEGEDDEGPFLFEATSGHTQRTRPNHYAADYMLAPGRCTKI
jgi:transglutaminase-like putative cysteine protease